MSTEGKQPPSVSAPTIHVAGGCHATPQNVLRAWVRAGLALTTLSRSSARAASRAADEASSLFSQSESEPRLAMSRLSRVTIWRRFSYFSSQAATC